jgi:hypothetical protein
MTTTFQSYSIYLFAPDAQMLGRPTKFGEIVAHLDEMS